MEKLRILHLEDETHFAELVQSILADSGIENETTQARSRQEFSQALERGGIDLILADHSLPDFDGVSALNLARQKCPSVPLVFLSGVMPERQAVECLKNGAADYVLKGEMSRLVPTVLRTLNSYREAQALRIAQERIRVDGSSLRGIIENTSDGIWSMDLEFRILAFNSPASLLAMKISGQPLQIGTDFLEYLPSDGREMWRMAAGRIANRERFQEHFELAWDGRVSHYEVSFNPIRAERNVTGMAVFCRNVTERLRVEEALIKAKESAEESSKAKGQFLANMSHEIRTPMNGVVSMVGLLADSQLDEKQRQYVKVIQTSAHSLLAIIDDILDFSKIEQGKLRLDNRVLDLRDTVADAISLLEPRAREKNLDLRWSFAPGTPRVLVGDPGRLRQILVNLIGNAVKFTPAGWVQVRVCPEAGRQGMLRFEVEDTGIGLPPEAGREMFRAFSQADGSNTRRFGGTGLGLAISKQLSSMMGGEMGYTSRGAGQGSTFWFTLHMESPDSRELALELKRKEDAKQGSGWSAVLPLRILVAEDNPINRMVTASLLEKLGYLADLADDGVQAVRACRERDYDVVFMDCHMPELDGYAATAAIRRLESEGKKRPRIVAMTADALVGTREKCLAAGMDGYIAKPILMETLREELARVGGPQDSSPAPARAGAPAHSVGSGLDMRLVDRLRLMCEGGKTEAFRDLCAGFLRQAAEKCRELGTPPSGGDLHRHAETIHSLKGICLTFGAVAMAESCDTLQARAGSGDGEGFAATLERLEGQLDAARRVLSAQSGAEPADFHQRAPAKKASSA